MKLTNATRFAAGYAMGRRPDGRDLLVVVAKATFTLPADGAEPHRAQTQADLVEADVPTGEPGVSANRYESDFAPVKPMCDVLLNGSAYAPGGVAASRVPVALQVGPVRKAFAVVGRRAWVRGLLGPSATRPIPFTQLPFSYDVAYGGADRSIDPPAYYTANHAGLGYLPNANGAAIHEKPLPNTEEEGAEVTSPRGKYRPMAFGPVGRAWEPRFRLAGTYDEKWLEDVCPFLPADFKEEYYQAAPPDQRMPYLQGGERVTLLNLTAAGRTAFTVPRLDVPVHFFGRDGGRVEQRAVADTLLIEPDLSRFSITLRTHVALRRNLFEIAEVVVGRLSRGRLRAREQGKHWFSSVGALVRSRLS